MSVPDSTAADLSTIRVATRGSALALIQTRQVIELLAGVWPGFQAEIVTAIPVGDRDKQTPLTTLGQGVFVKGVEAMLLAGHADVAVHSLKDVPTTETPGLVLAAFPVRVDPRDGLVCRIGRNLLSLPARPTVATGSPRRAAQLLALRADLRIVEVRGNLDTRLKKLRDGDFDALTVAVAGMERMGRLGELDQVFEVDECTPAAGQGVLAVQCCADDVRTRRLLTALDDRLVRAEVLAERAFLAQLGGGCEIPAGAIARAVDAQHLDMLGVVASPDGKHLARERQTGDLDNSAAIGRALADRLLPLARELLGTPAAPVLPASGEGERP
jgi:hydroxymethylbilane synthase